MSEIYKVLTTGGDHCLMVKWWRQKAAEDPGLKLLWFLSIYFFFFLLDVGFLHKLFLLI